MPRSLRFAMLLLVVGACTHASQSGRGTPENVITQEEIIASEAITVYDVIQKLRRNFLTDRGKTTLIGNAPSKPNVFLDGSPYGAFESLRNIPAQQVATIRLYRAWEAQQKFGNGNAAGVIEVTTRQQ